MSMNLTIFSSQIYDKQYFERFNTHHVIEYIDSRLDITTLSLAKESDAICAFVNDDLGEAVLKGLKNLGIKIIALRCAGFNNVDLNAAKELGIKVVRVPAYSPHSVAEHAVALILTLNRKTHQAYNRVKECNFSLNGLMGFDLYGKSAGIVGTGRIGTELAKILTGFGMKVYANDLVKNKTCLDLGVEYVTLSELLEISDVISFHCPLTSETNHLIDKLAVKKMKKGVMLINTSRGAVLNTVAVIEGLKDKTIGYLGIDVYEHESNLFFTDMSGKEVKDVCLHQLLDYKNVLITGHQAFFTNEAMKSIAQTTLESLSAFEKGNELIHKI